MFKPIILVLVCFLPYVLSQNDSARKELFNKLVANLCGPNLAADKAKIIKDCENNFPKIAQDVFSSCAKEALGITEITQPKFCYKALPESNKLIECMKEREAELAERGLVIDEKQKDKVKDLYLGCISKAL